MNDFRLTRRRATVALNTCVMVPAGTKIVLCAAGGLPVKEVTLTNSWFIMVEDAQPEVNDDNV